MAENKDEAVEAVAKAPRASRAKAVVDAPAAEKKPAVKTAAEKKPTKAAAVKAVEHSEASKPAAKSKSSAKAVGKAPVELGNGGVLRVHHLRPAPGAKTAKTRVGRGEASKGKTAGRGTKGTSARYQVPERFEGGQMPMHMRLPKLRGFKNPFRTEYQVVNLGRLSELYPQGGSVTVDDLVVKGAVRKGSPVKVLGDGDLSVKLTVSVQKVSASAAEKIVAAGGTIAQA